MKSEKNIDIKGFIKKESEKKIMEDKKSPLIKKLLEIFAVHIK